MKKRLALAFVMSLLGSAGMMAASYLQSPARQPAAASAKAAQSPDGCEDPEAAAPPSQPLPPIPDVIDYVVGINDRLQIAVTPDIDPTEKCSKDYLIKTDGKIDFCFVGSVKVAGLSVRAVEQQLKKELLDRKLFTNVTVSAEVSQYRSQVVYVNGAVNQPGQVNLEGDPRRMTLIRAINLAGNFAANAGPDIYVLRSENATGPITESDATAEKQKYSRKWLQLNMEDVPIRSGDTIWVQPAEPIFINGEVRSPGSGQQVWEPCMTIKDLVDKVGGLSDKASLRRSYIERKNAKGGYDRIKGLKLETRLQPRDHVTIVKSLF